MKTVSTSIGFALGFIGIAMLLGSDLLTPLLIGKGDNQITSEKVCKLSRRGKILATIFLAAGMVFLASDPPLFGS